MRIISINRGRSGRAIVATVFAIALLAGSTFAAESSQADPARRPATPVLGSTKYAQPYGEGWGHVRPAVLSNGGDPSGYISAIRWKHWGAGKAYGLGKNAIFKPGGGYYPQPVTIQLRAQNLGRCGTHRAYTKLWVREPSKPGGKVGPWFSWSGKYSLCSHHA